MVRCRPRALEEFLSTSLCMPCVRNNARIGRGAEVALVVSIEVIGRGESSESRASSHARNAATLQSIYEIDKS